MTVCEFLHCSYSELNSRCPSLADKIMVLEYIKEKAAREKYAMDHAQNRGR
jgi:hypothetical protein